MSICSALDLVTVLQLPLVEQNTNSSFLGLNFSSFAKNSHLKPILYRRIKPGLRLIVEKFSHQYLKLITFPRLKFSLRLKKNNYLTGIFLLILILKLNQFPGQNPHQELIVA